MTVPGYVHSGSEWREQAARLQAQSQARSQAQSQSQAVQRRRKSTSVSLLLGVLALVCLAVLCSEDPGEDPDLLSIGRRSLAARKRKWGSGVYFERTGSSERQTENVLALSTRTSEQAVIKVMSGANELYMDKVLALADRVKLFGTTLSIVPFNWIPPPSLAGTEKKKKRKKSKTKTKTYVFEEPIADEILPAKLAAISRAVDNGPLHSQVLWIDADTLVLNDVTTIARRSAANGCDMSIHRRAGNCATDSGWKISRKKYAAGIISVTVSNATRAFFKDAYHLSKTDPSCRQWKRSKNMYWYQDQLALLKAFERAPNNIVLCDLNEDEMYIARPHDCGSLKGVSNSTITFSGEKTLTVLRLEGALLDGNTKTQ